MTIDQKVDFICEYVSFNKEEVLARKHSMVKEINELYDCLKRLTSIK